MKKLIFTLIIITLYSCVGKTDENGYPIINYDNEHIEFRDDIVYYKGTPFNGKITKYFENSTYLEYEKDYRNEGKIKYEYIYDEEGNVITENIYFDNGKLFSNRSLMKNGQYETNYSKEVDSLTSLLGYGVSSGESENGDCFTRDNNFIQNKMKQLNRDIVSIQNTGNRNYFVQYVDWRTGTGQQGSVVLDYSNSPCN